MEILTASDIDGKTLFVESYKDSQDRPKAFCNGCRSELTFKEGKATNLDGTKRKSHFAHKSNCECDWTNESDLHKIIKHIIFEAKFLKVKRFYFNHKDQEGFEINIENPKLELFGGGMECPYRPDICGTWNGELIWIEAVVTHKCEENKIKYILENDITCIEVSLCPEEFKKKSKREIQDLIKRDFDLFDTRIVNIKGLRRKVFEQEKSRIRKRLQLIKECSSSDSITIETLYQKIENLSNTILYSNLNELEKIKSYSFMHKLAENKVSMFIDSQIIKNTLKSAIITKELLEDTPIKSKDIKDKCLNYYNNKMYKEAPAFKIGIYKGLKMNKAIPEYIKFIQMTKLDIFSSEVLEYATTLESNKRFKRYFLKPTTK